MKIRWSEWQKMFRMFGTHKTHATYTGYHFRHRRHEKGNPSACWELYFDCRCVTGRKAQYQQENSVCVRDRELCRCRERQKSREWTWRNGTIQANSNFLRLCMDATDLIKMSCPLKNMKLLSKTRESFYERRTLIWTSYIASVRILRPRLFQHNERDAPCCIVW